MTDPIFDAFVSKVTQRQAARTLVCTRKTVRRRLILLALHTREVQAAVLERARLRGSFGGRFQFDEQETFERDRRLRPVTLPVLIHQDSRFIVHIEAAALPARGGLRPRHVARKLQLEAKEGVRESGSRAAVRRCFEVLARVLGVGARAVVVTDQKSSYATVLAETMAGRCVHERYSGKLPKKVSSPLWPINHTLAMLRDGPSRLVRNTWGATKERAWLAEHVWIWIAYRNYIRCLTNKQKHTTSAVKAGLVSRTFSKSNFFEWRVFPVV